MYVTHIDDGEYIRLRGVDFGQKGASKYLLQAAAKGRCTVTLRLDSTEGPVVGTLDITDTKSLEKYKQFSAKVRNVSGVHDLYICFSKATGDIRLDYWMFK